MGIVSYIKEEIRVVRERDPAIKIKYGSVALSKFSCNTQIQSGS